jgi:hypothetical protein
LLGTFSKWFRVFIQFRIIQIDYFQIVYSLYLYSFV